MWIQILISIFSAFAILRVAQNYRSRRFSLSSSLFWSIVWLSVAVVFWFPETASRLAVALGIGRGADLVTYSAIIVLVYLVYRLFVRAERMEHAITELTRAISLHDTQDGKDHTSHTHRQL